MVTKKIVFDEYDISHPWTNASETVQVWANSTPVFGDLHDQVQLQYTILQSDYPVEVMITYSTTDIAVTQGSRSSTSIKYSLSIGNLEEGSKITITLDWTSLLDQQPLDEIIYDPEHDSLRQYRISSQLITTESVWEQNLTMRYEVTIGERTVDLPPENITIDASQALFANETRITTTSITDSEIHIQDSLLSENYSTDADAERIILTLPVYVLLFVVTVKRSRYA